jgi:LmbE family N-acetylglucosaminyl deacetylase
MHPAAPDRVLFIFAHQDDEMAAASRILFERARNSVVFCAFLTDGTLGRATARVRDAESTVALASLGVAPSRILFIGSQVPIADGSLVDHLEIALRNLEQAMAGENVTTVYCLAWEGGHHDHDASHLVAIAFAARRGILDRCFEMPLYRASAVRPLFRVLAPMPPKASWQRRPIPLREGLRIAFLVRHYVSQRRSWIGLFPGLFTRLVLLRSESIRRVDPARVREQPHTGTLLYVSRFGCSTERFFSAARPFAEAHLPPADRR